MVKRGAQGNELLPPTEPQTWKGTSHKIQTLQLQVRSLTFRKVVRFDQNHTAKLIIESRQELRFPEFWYKTLALLDLTVITL